MNNEKLIEDLVDLVAPWYEEGEQEKGGYLDSEDVVMANKIRGHIREIEHENITKILNHLREIDWNPYDNEEDDWGR